MESALKGVKPKFDLEKIYAKYKNVLKGAKEGDVITRFPPEPSGYLHIGHAKAAFLNYHYSKMFKGKLILRFDDTNPSKEKVEYIDSIIQDLKTLKITGDIHTNTSDNFQLIADKCTWMIEQGHAYCDNTPLDQMRQERFDGIKSGNRDNSVEENLRVWKEMKLGSEEGKTYCVRAKISIDSLNKCMRDPTMYRCNDTPHPKTGNKWKVYPIYDFACPIVDSIEGVTHAMRTNEYADRNAQYEWFIKVMGLRKVKIQDYSRLNFVNTTLSKRKLKWFVEEGLVDGWNDPRFPTVQGVLRRGMLVETLIEFMLEQGPSKSTVLMEWDKIWALNKKNMESICAKLMAISTEKTALVELSGVPSGLSSSIVPVHPKNAEMGQKPHFTSNKIMIDWDDAKDCKVDERITFMKWGIFKVTAVEQNGDSVSLKADYLPEDKDYNTTRKVHWLVDDKSVLHRVRLIEYAHLLKVAKVEAD